ncbi:MAG: hypothetical protein IPL27_04550 [Lewinellaceae bacterium]|nr:hypothetical protein [Lewinellaceae bacterium]
MSVHRQLTDLAGTSRRAFNTSEDALAQAQKNWAGWFLKNSMPGKTDGGGLRRIYEIPR